MYLPVAGPACPCCGREPGQCACRRQPPLSGPVMDRMLTQFGVFSALVLGGFVWFVWPKKKVA